MGCWILKSMSKFQLKYVPRPRTRSGTWPGPGVASATTPGHTPGPSFFTSIAVSLITRVHTLLRVWHFLQKFLFLYRVNISEQQNTLSRFVPLTNNGPNAKTWLLTFKSLDFAQISKKLLLAYNRTKNSNLWGEKYTSICNNASHIAESPYVEFFDFCHFSQCAESTWKWKKMLAIVFCTYCVFGRFFRSLGTALHWHFTMFHSASLMFTGSLFVTVCSVGASASQCECEVR